MERYETTKKIKFMFISQKCSKYCNLSRFHINSFLFFLEFRTFLLQKAHVICDCNICQGAEVDPRTKESHMKKEKFQEFLPIGFPKGLLK